MKYQKAQDILPPELLQELQKYVRGEMVYIPIPSERYRGWGERSGQRAYLKQRNEAICRAFEGGSSIDALTEAFGLSHDSIKKIVYSRNKARR